METLKIKLGNIYLLESELNGLSQTNQETGESTPVLKGFINEKLPLSTKFWLLELNKEVQAIKATLESLREDLIKKYGTANDQGQISIPLYQAGSEVYDTDGKLIDAKPNEAYIKFQEEYSGLINEEKELQYTPIPLTVIDKIETDETYSFILQNLIEKIS